MKPFSWEALPALCLLFAFLVFFTDRSLVETLSFIRNWSEGADLLSPGHQLWVILSFSFQTTALQFWDVSFSTWFSFQVPTPPSMFSDHLEASCVVMLSSWLVLCLSSLPRIVGDGAFRTFSFRKTNLPDQFGMKGRVSTKEWSVEEDQKCKQEKMGKKSFSTQGVASTSQEIIVPVFSKVGFFSEGNWTFWFFSEDYFLLLFHIRTRSSFSCIHSIFTVVSFTSFLFLHIQ